MIPIFPRPGLALFDGGSFRCLTLSHVQTMSRTEIYDNASLLIGAGSETTATALSAATYLLAMNPDVLARLVTEVRESFSSESQIDFVSVQKLDYMLAVLDETLRLHPPSPNANLRSVCDGGDVICGQFVPHGVSFLPSPTALKEILILILTDQYRRLAVRHFPRPQELLLS